VAEANRAMHWAGAARWDQTLAVALVGALVGGGLYLGNRAYVEAGIPTPCGAGCVTFGSAPLSSDQEMLDVESAIANGNATSGGPYVSVALLDPFTYSTSGTISQVRIIDELRGAATAQRVANSQGGIKIHLLLANEGTSGEEGEAQAVQLIEQLEVPDHIVAVAGMGLSTANTQTAAAALSADGIPMFGAVTTGDDFDSNTYQGFYQIVPDVAAQVKQWWTKLQTTLQRGRCRDLDRPLRRPRGRAAHLHPGVPAVHPLRWSLDHHHYRLRRGRPAGVRDGHGQRQGHRRVHRHRERQRPVIEHVCDTKQPIDAVV